MKKIWMILLAMLLATGLVLVGCGGSGSSDDDWDGESNLSGLTITLVVNQYGGGYQGFVDSADLFNGSKVVKDDEYELTIEFTVSRDVTDDLQIGLVDNDGGWERLSWTDAIDAYSIDKSELTVTAGTISKTITLTAYATAVGNSIKQNNMVFQTETEDQTLADLVLTFSKFEFKKTGAGEVVPVDTKFFDDAVGLSTLTFPWGTSNSVAFDSTKNIVTIDTSQSSGILGVPLPGGLTASDSIVITYAALITSPSAGMIVKYSADGGSSFGDASGGTQYPTFAGGTSDIQGKVETLTLELQYAAAYDLDYVYFQPNSNNNTSALWQLKIISVAAAE